jgi:hypothetical protein
VGLPLHPGGVQLGSDREAGQSHGMKPSKESQYLSEAPTSGVLGSVRGRAGLALGARSGLMWRPEVSAPPQDVGSSAPCSDYNRVPGAKARSSSPKGGHGGPLGHSWIVARAKSQARPGGGGCRFSGISRFGLDQGRLRPFGPVGRVPGRERPRRRQGWRRGRQSQVMQYLHRGRGRRRSGWISPFPCDILTLVYGIFPMAQARPETLQVPGVSLRSGGGCAVRSPLRSPPH